ncbi:hypothetical protein [Photobacterium atrarenae]|uniref:KfrA N-terminal DNA-binding domain-containing protein n=1 Tax=Photobacterium atrarenae TaxID=865757 RepID=A0ABY5GLF0_9GAMM|nr:hypothetical protein [Photobacterium atrarenae]UTV30142.1 hypothetical protein NNL38_16280 [Photobacterium atrarenae]
MSRNPQSNPSWAWMPLKPEAYFHIQTQWALQSAKQFEAVIVEQARKSIQGSYQQTLTLLGELDQNLKDKNRAPEHKLCFPFDVLDSLTRSTTNQWRAVVGLGSSRESALREELRNQEHLLNRTQKQFSQEKTALAEALSRKDAQLEQVKAEADKAAKAKNTAQRSQRKLKTELEASQAENAVLKQELDAIKERCDHQSSQSEQQFAAMKAENEKLLAETERLRQQLAAKEQQQA